MVDIVRKNEKISVLFCGQIASQRQVDRLNNATSALLAAGFAEVIVSTWEGLDFNFSPDIKLVTSRESDVTSASRQFSRDNLHKMVATRYAGLQSVSTEFSLILRTDMYVSEAHSLDKLTQLQTPVVALEGTRHPIRTLAPFYLSDFMFFCETLKAIKIFEFESLDRKHRYGLFQSMWANSQVKNLDTFWDNEQALSIKMLEIYDVALPSSSRLRDCLKTLEVLRSGNVSIVRLNLVGIKLPKRLISNSQKMWGWDTGKDFVAKTHLFWKITLGWLLDPYFIDSYRRAIGHLLSSTEKS